MTPPKKPAEHHDNNDEELIEFHEWHCASCGHFLALHLLEKGMIMQKCRYCKNWNTLEVEEEVQEENP